MTTLKNRLNVQAPSIINLLINKGNYSGRHSGESRNPEDFIRQIHLDPGFRRGDGLKTTSRISLIGGVPE